MSSKYTTIQLRRGNNAAFSGKVLASGEPAYALDTSVLKVGDGTTAWGSLGSLSSGSGMSEVVDDTTPQLGGNLDLNSKDWTGTGYVIITGSGNFTQGVFLNGATAVKSDTTGISNSSGVVNLVKITQANYDALGSYDANTVYFIV